MELSTPKEKSFIDDGSGDAIKKSYSTFVDSDKNRN
jgi:hypothetical protein